MVEDTATDAKDSAASRVVETFMADFTLCTMVSLGADIESLKTGGLCRKRGAACIIEEKMRRGQQIG